MFERVQEIFNETGLMNEFCEHLRQIGINAKLLESGSPESIGVTWLGCRLGCFKVENRNLDLIQVERLSVGNGEDSRSELWYEYTYLVRADSDGREGMLKAEIKSEQCWEGGCLAQLLNADYELKNLLLKVGLSRLEIRPDKRNQCIRIIPSQWSWTMADIGGASFKARGRKDFPTREAFEAYDRIAQHIHNTATSNP